MSACVLEKMKGAGESIPQIDPSNARPKVIARPNHRNPDFPNGGTWIPTLHADHGI